MSGSLDSRELKLWYGAGLAVYRVNENLFAKVGLLLSDALSSSVIQLAGVSYLFAPQWRLEILAPRRFEVSYRTAADWDHHTGVQVDAEEYAIEQGGLHDSKEIDIRIRDVRFYVGALHKLESDLSYFIRAGVAYHGSYEWTDECEGDMEPAPFMSAGIGWHF